MLLYLTLGFLGLLFFVLLFIFLIGNSKEDEQSGKFGTAKQATLKYLKKNRLIIPPKYIKMGWIAIGYKDNQYVGVDKLDRFRHTTVISPSRQGKTVSVAIPRILDSQDSCFILDLKSELFQTTYEESIRKGKIPIALDPYSLLDRYAKFPKRNIIKHMNPLNPQYINIQNESLLDEYIDSLVSSLSSDSKYDNDHFKDAAEALIGALLEHHIQNKKTLVDLFDTYNQLSYDDVITILDQMQIDGSRRAISAKGLLQKVDKKEGGGFLSTTFRSFAYLSSSVWANFFSKDGFDFGELVDKKTDLYFIIPTRMATQHVKVVRLLLNMFMINFELASPKKLANRKFEVFIDEAGQIKCPKEIEKIIEIYGEKGMCLTTFFQSIDHVEKMFEKPGLILGADIVHIFGETDPKAMKWIQQRAGEQTIENNTYNKNQSRSYNAKMNNSKSRSGGTSSSEIGVSLYHTNEISEMPFSDQIIFLRGYRSIWARKIGYYMDPRYKKRHGTNYVEEKGLIEL
jgi:type IV secretion system protein VirD4